MADLEFPNDLLWELDKMEFYIPETKETVKAKQRPIVIITSNAEKELPDAFLRRCIFHYIAFPTQEQMEKIIRVHFDKLDEALLAQAMPGPSIGCARSTALRKSPPRASWWTGSARSARRRRSRAHHARDPLCRRAAQKGQGHHGDAAPDAVSPCSSDFSTFCVSAASAFHSTSG